MQIGLHVSISGSVANAVTNAIERECSAFQIFTGNPRGWYSKDLTNEDISNYKKKVITIITKKNLFIWDNDKLFKLHKKSKSFKIYFQSSQTPLFLECKNFVSDISAKKPIINSAILARDIVIIISKINKKAIKI